MLQSPDHKLILASKSRGRQELLRGAGLSFEALPADLDERAIEQTLWIDDKAPDPLDVAMLLAMAKAEHVSRQHPDAYVIGADQVLALDNEIFEKPTDMQTARRNLLRFRGRTHYLHAAICVSQGGDVIWRASESAAMTMRDFSAEFLDEYLTLADDSVLSSVGAYRLEESGVHLFEKIDGDYFTILGLPMLPLLNFLRHEKLILA